MASLLVFLVGMADQGVVQRELKTHSRKATGRDKCTYLSFVDSEATRNVREYP
jgi:hypothetical protein